MERFDYDSGLVYRETIIRPRKGQRPWVHRCPSDQMSKVPLDTRDVQSLRAIAMRRIVDQAHTLTLETLKAVPATIVVQIWNEIRRAYVSISLLYPLNTLICRRTGHESLYISGKSLWKVATETDL